jgi:hypothetical protein
MPTDILAFLPVLSLILSLAALAGGILAFRSGYSKQASEIQEKVIDALKTQNETQATQIVACEKEIGRLKQIVVTIQYALKRRGLRIEIDGNAITLIDEAVSKERTVQIQITDKPEDDKDKTEKH